MRSFHSIQIEKCILWGETKKDKNDMYDAYKIF